MLPELRKDPLSGRWVILAPQRATRPQDLGAAKDAPVLARCPFCPGGEIGTPAEVLAVRDPGSIANGPGWRVRVVPNKYPAVVEMPDKTIDHFLPNSHDPTQLGRGVHEVIIESPRHLHTNTQQSPDELAEVVWVYRERLRALASSGQWRYGLIFKNVGFAAGASLEHLHSQVVALPIVPSAIEETLRATAIFHKERRDCYFCDLVRREISEGMRVVAETAHFAAICPFASRFAFETWIIPKRHAAAFSAADEDELSDLAGMLSNVLRKLELGLDKPAYNYAIRTAPFDRHTAEHYHWHIEIFPRVTRLAGFELSTDFYINVVRPEDAAALLRRT